MGKEGQKLIVSEIVVEFLLLIGPPALITYIKGGQNKLSNGQQLLLMFGWSLIAFLILEFKQISNWESIADLIGFIMVVALGAGFAGGGALIGDYLYKTYKEPQKQRKNDDSIEKGSLKVESTVTAESDDQPTTKVEAQRTNSNAYSNVKPVGDIIPGPLVKPENLDRAQQAINEAMLETREESKEKAVSVAPTSISKSELEPIESQPELKPEIDTLPVNELKLLKELYDDGVITENEFSEKKKVLLGL